MRNYLLLQLKRLGRFLPVALCVTALLLGGLAIAAGQIATQSEQGENNQKIRVAIAGQTDHGLIQMGFAALTSFDSTRYTMEVLTLKEAEAEAALRSGDIAAYAVIPPGFMESALKGNMMTLRFVSRADAGDLITLFKAELTEVISDLIIGSQKGVFGMELTLRENGLSQKLPGQMNKLSLEYVDYILYRDHVYTVEELGVADNLTLTDSLVCGLAVLLLLLMCLPFAPVMIRSDHALARMLHARRLSAVRQTLAEFAAYGLTLTALVGVPLLVTLPLWQDRMAVTPLVALGRLLPVLWLVAALSFLLYAISDHLIGGVLVHFFTTLALCFVSGCLYPVFFFPAGVQTLANRLPTGLARTQIAGCLTGADTASTALWLWGVGGLCLLIATLLRLRKIKGVAR
ncbi:MAG: ABC transporter permease [Ruminococcaceae bacterium]|nr:ABC transporter permease [Oscillospiraceae bacterium]